jgi:hypothetical protein
VDWVDCSVSDHRSTHVFSYSLVVIIATTCVECDDEKRWGTWGRRVASGGETQSPFYQF